MPYIPEKQYRALQKMAFKSEMDANRRMLGDIAIQLYEGDAGEDVIEAFGVLSRWIGQRERLYQESK